MEPDHPERHDLWARRNSARDSALAENICVGVSDCARARRSGQTFSFVNEKKKKRWRRTAKWYPDQAREKGKETQSEREKKGRNGVHIIMDPTTEKSETSRRELHERRPYVRTYLRVHVYVRTRSHTHVYTYMYYTRESVEDHLLS